MTRKEFLSGCLAVGALPTLRSFAAGVVEKPILKLGVLSDIHIKNPGDESTFVTALEFFRRRNVDGVLIAGDMADTGRVSQLKLLAEAWYEVFPDGKYPDGRTCEQLFVYGNHDLLGWSWNGDLKAEPALAEKDGIGYQDNPGKTWEACFHEPYEPIWLKKVNGCTIVGGHWDYGRQEQWDAFLKRRAADIDMTKPLVLAQHPHPKDTCMGAWAWGHDGGESTAALAAYPNAVIFSGHSHYPLTDERSVWQGAFTSVNTASLKYASIDYSLRENMPGNGLGGYRGEKRKHAMPTPNTHDGRQGMVVSFFGDRLEIERREFVYGVKSLGPDWIVPWPAKNDGGFSFANRAADRHAPEFAADAKLDCRLTKGDEQKQIPPRLELEFPAARSVRGCRPYEYEVTAILCEDDVELVQAQRRVMASGYYLPEELADKPTSCVFDPAELPCKGHYRFEVRPLECFGRKGKSLVAELSI